MKIEYNPDTTITEEHDLDSSIVNGESKHRFNLSLTAAELVYIAAGVGSLNSGKVSNKRVDAFPLVDYVINRYGPPEIANQMADLFETFDKKVVEYIRDHYCNPPNPPNPPKPTDEQLLKDIRDNVDELKDLCSRLR